MTGRGLTLLLYVLAALGLLLLGSLLIQLVVTGWPVLSWPFIVSDTRQVTAGGGIGPALINTLYMVGLAMAVSVPIGLAAALLRVEYIRDRRVADAIESTAELLASLPSVVVGLGLFALLVGVLHWPFSRLTGTAALVAINIPWAAAAAMGVLKAVPDSLREGSLALGATRFQTVRRVVLPRSWPALVSGLGVGGARLLGESAALIFTAGVNAAPGQGWDLWSPGATLAVHLFYARTEGLMPDANGVAAATGVVLLVLLVLLLAVGHGLAAYFSRRAGIR